MLIGVPKEIKDNENRVALTPAGVVAYRQAGHEVLVETRAGVGSGFSDEEYRRAGAQIVADAAEVWGRAEMICKVKEPLPSEYAYFRSGQILFTYLHLAAAPDLTRALMEKKVVAIAYETVQAENGSLPLLTPMSEVAGRMAVQAGAQFLQKPYGGKGVLLGGVPGVLPGKVVIIGGGVVGTNAAKMALGLGAEVTLLDVDAGRMRQLDDLFQGRIRTLMSNPQHIAEMVKEADLLIGAVLVTGARAPRLVSEAMVKTMAPGSVIVDVAVDQGGSIETIDRATTHSDPVYLKHDVVHYAVANMPGAVPRTSTVALSNVTVPYGLQLANKGYERAVRENRELARGVNVIDGRVVHEAVAASLNLPYTPLDELFSGAPV
ncbi:alanine dehydrogenase [Brevibacillus marinus]|uniref:alanine dehydrogenase n=1 Tax=Brevibacillus marinus TaxID=2496837 RepID=UPI000F81DC3A|nr:alanine dehydrogenase [Brevibacillus marinus]